MNRVTSVAGIAALSAILVTDVVEARPLETKTENISIPVGVNPLVTTAEKYPVNTVYWPCPLAKSGTAPDPASPGFHRVGWTHIYDAGTNPAPCRYRLNHVQRIATTFDLKEIEEDLPSALVDEAILSFDRKRVAGDHDCRDQILTIVEGAASIPPNVEDHWEFKAPMLGSPDCEGSRCRVNIKSQLNAWLRKVVPNLGLAFIGDQERLDANDNVSCLTEYGNFRLDVKYRHDVEKGGMVIPILPKGLELLRKELTVTFVRKTTDEAIYDLSWTNTSTGKVDIMREDVIVVPNTDDDGNQRVRAPLGTVRFKVCKSGICSNSVTVSS